MKAAVERATEYLSRLVEEIGERHPGSASNQRATEFAAGVLAAAGWSVQTPEFNCLDWEDEGASLEAGGRSYNVLPGPYSLPVDCEAPLCVISTGKELAAVAESGDAAGSILLLRGEAAAEQLFPKRFPFYQAPEHLEIYRLIEQARPAAVVAATARNPETAGAVYPFPMIEDGDFHIPNAYMKDSEGDRLIASVRNGGASSSTEPARLSIRSRRIESTARNVIARRGAGHAPRLILTAHIDSKYGTPGALDNGAGVVAVLIAAELISERLGATEASAAPVEILLFNGEDYYAASGQVHYLKSEDVSSESVSLAVNVDAIGLRDHRTAFSLYEVSPELASRLRGVFDRFPGVTEGPSWYQSDHMVFMQAGAPAVAIVSERFAEDIAAAVAHTPGDSVDLVDPAILVESAEALVEIADMVAGARVRSQPA